MSPPSAFDASWLLLGAPLSVRDDVSRGFLVFTVALWLAAALFAWSHVRRTHVASFWVAFVVTGGANVGLVLAADVATFYAFYALLTFGSYGLVAHACSDASRRAARVYMMMALLAEAALLTALVVLCRERINLPLEDAPRSVAASRHRDLLTWLLLFGFGVKAGFVPLHGWLPLAHPVAAAPASAVLSGSIVAAGLLGMLRFLPLGLASQPVHGVCLAVAGGLGIFWACAVGVTQRDPKTVLAYSTVSQTGFSAMTLGVALVFPSSASAAVAAVVVFVLHHAFAKAALFLGVVVAKGVRRPWSVPAVNLGLLLPALAIAGAPATSGSVAKASLGAAATQAPVAAPAFGVVATAGAVASTLLMMRILTLTGVHRGGGGPGLRMALVVPWAALVVASPALIFAPGAPDRLLPEVAFDAGAVLSAAWPIAFGVGLAMATTHLLRWAGRSLPEIPAGDVVVIAEALCARAARRARQAARQGERASIFMASLRSRVRARLRAARDAADRAEERLAAVETTLVLLVVVLAVSASLAFAQ